MMIKSAWPRLTWFFSTVHYLLLLLLLTPFLLVFGHHLTVHSVEMGIAALGPSSHDGVLGFPALWKMCTLCAISWHIFPPFSFWPSLLFLLRPVLI